MQIRWLAVIVACLLVCVAAPEVEAAVITFDEFAADNTNGPMPALRYAALGVTFVATDDGTTWGGLSNGDPGNWDLDGTNGPIFSGFNGSSYGLTMLFNSSVVGFGLDVSRSAGSSPGNTFTLEGYRGGSLVETATIRLGAINDWSAVSLAEMVDEVRWFGTGTGFHPYGIDDVTWEAVPEPATLALLGAGLAILGFRRRRPRQ